MGISIVDFIHSNTVEDAKILLDKATKNNDEKSMDQLKTYLSLHKNWHSFMRELSKSIEALLWLTFSLETTPDWTNQPFKDLNSLMLMEIQRLRYYDEWSKEKCIKFAEALYAASKRFLPLTVLIRKDAVCKEPFEMPADNVKTIQKALADQKFAKLRVRYEKELYDIVQRDMDTYPSNETAAPGKSAAGKVAAATVKSAAAAAAGKSAAALGKSAAATVKSAAAAATVKSAAAATVKSAAAAAGKRPASETYEHPPHKKLKEIFTWDGVSENP